MPAKASRKRPNVRSPSPGQGTGDDSAQPMDRDQEDEVVQPKRERATKKRTNSKANRVPNPEADEDDAGPADGGGLDTEEQQRPTFDPASFIDQPLPQEAGRNLASLGGDWERLNAQLKDVMKMCNNAAMGIEETKQNEDDARLNKLEEDLKFFIDLESVIKAHVGSVDSLRQRIAVGEEVSDAVDQYQKRAEDATKEYSNRTQRQKYLKHSAYEAFKQAIWEVNHPDAAMPLLTTYLPRDDGDESDEDDLIIGGMTQNYKCPLTLVPLQDPMTSPRCGHSYSREAIKDLLKKGPAKCPTTGCTQEITFADLQPNKDLARKVKAAMRREKEREEEQMEDVEDVDDIVD